MQQPRHFTFSTGGENVMLKLPVSGTTQCVGFARRWLEINLGLTFPDVHKAADIWHKVTHYKRLSDSRQLHVINCSNGHVRSPQYGDLVIYDQYLDGTGHVAIVTAVDQISSTISVTEQNYMNRYQPPGKQRQVPFLKVGDGFRLLQRHIIGWKHISTNEA